jgi:hypothetical protein
VITTIEERTMYIIFKMELDDMFHFKTDSEPLACLFSALGFYVSDGRREIVVIKRRAC